VSAESGRRGAYLRTDFLVIFLLTACLIWPLFKAKYLDTWASIESTFISDARFLREHWPHPQWQPLWYGGTRFDYIYPPALRYGTAALAKYYPMTEARAYHIYVAFFYCIGIAGVYLLVRLGCGSRGAAWLAAAAAALLSPAFLFMPSWRADAFLHHPARLGVLVRYGEGPHMTALALLPLALASSLVAIREWRPRATALAAIFCALVVSNNFYGAVALAICFPVLVWSAWIAYQRHGIWLRGLAIPVIAYGLTAFWLVPSYLRVTSFNLKLVSEPGNIWSAGVAVAALIAYLGLTAKLARGRQELFYAVFAIGLALFFALDVLGNQFAGFRVAGEPKRLTPELDLALILLSVEGLRRLWIRGAPGPRAIALGAALMAFATALPYASQAWRIIVRDPNYADRIEYKVSDWMASHAPQARAMATGSVRFWYDAWHDLPQLAGGSDQGVVNQLVNRAYMEIANGKIETALQWMMAYGVDAIIVHDKTSQEVYHDYVDPEKFAGALPVMFDGHAGDVIYRVPRRFPELARVVETSRVSRQEADPPLQAYAEALEKGPDSRALLEWDDVDAVRISAALAEGQSVLVQMAYDPQWRAESRGAALTIRKDAFGQMLIEAPTGLHNIRLKFETPLENRIGRFISLFFALAVLGLLIFK
jgi:Predicted integral membrane protein